MSGTFDTSVAKRRLLFRHREVRIIDDSYPAYRARRSGRVAVNLSRLRAPLVGLDLRTEDHVALTLMAAQTEEVVTALTDLFTRARNTPID